MLKPNIFMLRGILLIVSSHFIIILEALLNTMILQKEPLMIFFECFIKGEVDFGDYF